jgi:hypothetical protein
MAKNKDINISPSKGISIVIKNDFQPPAPTPKKKRKNKRKVNTDILKMPTIPSFIPTGDVSYIKPQYSTSSLNRNMIFPGTPQSLPQLPPPPQLPQLMPPPQLPQLMPPPQQPVNISFDNMFGSMLENALMPREYGFKQNSYAIDMLDDDIIDALPQEQQLKYMETKIAPHVQEQLKDVEFDNEDDKIKISKNIVNTRTSKSMGTRHANELSEYNTKYEDDEHYKERYIAKSQEIISEDRIRSKGGGFKINTVKRKEKARELLKAIAIEI